MTRIEYSCLHPWSDGLPNVPFGWTQGVAEPEPKLCERIIRAWHQSRRGQASGLWTLIADRYHGPLVRLLDSSDAAGLRCYLADIYAQAIFHGIDQTGEETASLVAGPQAACTHIVDRLAGLAEAMGLLPVENPEQGHWAENLYRSPNETLAIVESDLGVSIVPPIVARGRFGLQTNRGVLALKDLYAVYAAWRMREMGVRSVLEIGAGNGMGTPDNWAYWTGLTIQNGGAN